MNEQNHGCGIGNVAYMLETGQAQGNMSKIIAGLKRREMDCYSDNLGFTCAISDSILCRMHEEVCLYQQIL